MSKFKIKLKLQGLDLEIEGSKDDIPAISRNLADQVSGLLMPAANIVEGSDPGSARELLNVTPNIPPVSQSRGKRRPATTRRATPLSSGAGNSVEAFDWRHDAAAFGNPVQTWTTADKSMWLLYVVSKQQVTQEMSAPQIANTFNKHFRQAGPIRANNVSRDLGRFKTSPPPRVSEDSTKNPSVWFLTDEGIKHAETLVKSARGEDA